jgi:hypothetical protein
MSASEVGQVLLQVLAQGLSNENIAAIRSDCESFAEKAIGVLAVRFEEGVDGGRWLNVVFETYEPALLWPHIDVSLYQSASHGATLKAKSIAIRTGDDGWNDYVLMYHFDPNEPTERAS